MSRTMHLVLLVILFNAVAQTEGADFGVFMNKLSRATAKIKTHLVEFFYRFRSFFTRHSESTHKVMAARGCGYAVDDEPAIYHKRARVVSKIKGGDDAIWHTW